MLVGENEVLMMLAKANLLFLPGLSLADTEIFSACRLDHVGCRLQQARGLFE